jgi:hypothetical protein
MGDPHNPQRYGEVWDPDAMTVLIEAVSRLAPLGVISGGWAWHFMAPVGHIEYKHAHDHKDLDLLVPPASLTVSLGQLRAMGFGKAVTRHDSNTFMRYQRHVRGRTRPIKVTVDLFVETAPAIVVNGVAVAEPQYLLALYGTKHSSSECWSVQAARRLLAQGISPIGRSELVTPP